MTKHSNLSIIWHIHQPTFIPDYEVCDMVSESYMNILNIHEELKIPFCLNITGSLIERLLVLEPEFIIYIKKLVKINIIELLASAYYHPILPILSHENAKIQIKKDIELKRRVFKTQLKGFWPTDLAWAHWLIPLLKNEKIDWTIIDSPSLVQSNALPEWSNRIAQNLKVLSPEIKTITLKNEIHKPYFTEFFNDKMSIIIRDHEMTTYLTEFNNGVIYNENLIEDFKKNITNSLKDGDLLTIGDDGERINVQTARIYKQLLEFLINNGIKFQTPSTFLEKNPQIESRYFPASTFQYDLKAWINNMDDEVYFTFLRNISNKIELLRYIYKLNDNKQNIEDCLKKAEELLLKAEDSGCLFWRFLRRTKEPCYEYAYKALYYVDKGLRDCDVKE